MDLADKKNNRLASIALTQPPKEKNKQKDSNEIIKIDQESIESEAKNPVFEDHLNHLNYASYNGQSLTHSMS